MEQKTQRTEEEKREAMDKIGGFTYQFYCFLYNLLTMKDGDKVWFEKWDDAAIENGKLFTLFQAKHTVKAGSDGERYPLTNRSTDLWKALDVWRKMIVGTEDEPRYGKSHLHGAAACHIVRVYLSVPEYDIGALDLSGGSRNCVGCGIRAV